ncbi:hypothetical protein ACTGZU_11845, partial [Streptococcus suis]
MLGCAAGSVIGTSPAQWFEQWVAVDVGSGDVRPFETRLSRREAEDQIVEIAFHHVEYRGRACVVLAIRDLTERYRAQRVVEHLASHDPLTDLPNRAALDRHLAAAIAQDRPFSLIA